MKQGELAVFVIQPSYAYGNKGYDPKVSPNAVVTYEVELLSWKEPLPLFPSKEEMARADAKRKEEEAQLLLENPPPTLEERISTSEGHKSEGNNLFNQKQYEKAQVGFGMFTMILFS